MDRKMKLGLAAAAAIAVVGGIADLTRSPRAPETMPPLAERSGPNETACIAARDGLNKAVAVSPGKIANPRDGVLVLPPFFWSSLDNNQRTNLLTMLAVQKGCAMNEPVTGVDVELRSSIDNRLIGSGPAWNFDEAD
jgi:hypothetical protein